MTELSHIPLMKSHSVRVAHDWKAVEAYSLMDSVLLPLTPCQAVLMYWMKEFDYLSRTAEGASNFRVSEKKTVANLTRQASPILELQKHSNLVILVISELLES